jgi:hypothetical protein
MKYVKLLLFGLLIVLAHQSFGQSGESKTEPDSVTYTVSVEEAREIDMRVNVYPTLVKQLDEALKLTIVYKDNYTVLLVENGTLKDTNEKLIADYNDCSAKLSTSKRKRITNLAVGFAIGAIVGAYIGTKID